MSNNPTYKNELDRLLQPLLRVLPYSGLEAYPLQYDSSQSSDWLLPVHKFTVEDGFQSGEHYIVYADSSQVHRNSPQDEQLIHVFGKDIRLDWVAVWKVGEDYKPTELMYQRDSEVTSVFRIGLWTKTLIKQGSMSMQQYICKEANEAYKLAYNQAVSFSPQVAVYPNENVV